MKAKEKLIAILEENKKLKEELKMVKLKEQNDTQVSPSQNVSKSDGAKSEPDKVAQDDMAKKYEENEETKDTQTNPPQPVSQGDGDSAMKTDADKTSQDNMADKYPASKMEAEGDEADTPEEEEEPEPTEMEKFREMEDDMTKLVEVIESLKNRIEKLEGNGNGEEEEKPMEEQDEVTVDAEEEEDKAEEPEPPMTESHSLRDVFIETISKREDDFGKVVQKVIY